jgi:hypothetical protein
MNHFSKKAAMSEGFGRRVAARRKTQGTYDDTSMFRCFKKVWEASESPERYRSENDNMLTEELKNVSMVVRPKYCDKRQISLEAHKAWNSRICKQWKEARTGGRQQVPQTP